MRRRRLGLVFPVVLLAVLLAAVSVTWWQASSRILAELRRAESSQGPWRIAYDRVTCSGFPFRLDLDFENVRLREASGWGLQAGALKAEAYLFTPTHWVIVAPAGVVVQRPRGGPLFVAARALRASLSQADRRPPRLSVEGLNLTFSTPPGAAPFAVSAARELHIHTRAGPDDQGAAYLELDDARARLPGLLSRMADGRPVTFVADAIYSHADALAGPGLRGALADWAGAGGALQVRTLRLSAGEAVIDARPGKIAPGPDGRLAGRLTVDLRRADDLLAQTPAPGHPVASLPLTFAKGRTRLGPIDLGAAPKLF